MPFVRDERGQDLTEYTLLLAFIILACVAIFLVNFDSVQGIWGASNNKLILANQAAAS
jgi:Flp pilus assembly pilin Flp